MVVLNIPCCLLLRSCGIFLNLRKSVAPHPAVNHGVWIENRTVKSWKHDNHLPNSSDGYKSWEVHTIKECDRRKYVMDFLSICLGTNQMTMTYHDYLPLLLYPIFGSLLDKRSKPRQLLASSWPSWIRSYRYSSRFHLISTDQKYLRPKAKESHTTYNLRLDTLNITGCFPQTHT